MAPGAAIRVVAACVAVVAVARQPAVARPGVAAVAVPEAEMAAVAGPAADAETSHYPGFILMASTRATPLGVA